MGKSTTGPLASGARGFFMPQKVIMSPEDIRRTLVRIAHEIIEQNRKSVAQLVLIGIRTRGVPLAKRLAANIKELYGYTVPVIALDIGPYRDDIAPENSKSTAKNNENSFGIEGKAVVLVDDVLYTGRSTRAAMDAIVDRGRPQSIQLAVLVDRGHRELPIKPDFVGKNIPSAKHEEIQVRLVETDGVDEVDVIDTAREQAQREKVNNLGRTYHELSK